MSDEYGDAREELGKMLERKEIMEEIISQIDTCRFLRDKEPKNSVSRGKYNLVIDTLLHVAKTIQVRGVG
ncbi:hypothetical protein I4U30_22045 [Enterobacter asburiae]|uniref:hypothetical protein n=1 Tax=Enterobacter asburiae TaxID=61645 RepID=UPI00192BFC89|nr:hypothetical protein [Enterobacter asburiae]MBL5840953.1 hypothetical protein [Enterobacter asburiae]